MKKLIVVIIVLAAVGAGAGAYYMRKNTKEPEVRTAPITLGDVVQSVQATGTLEAVTTVEVGSQVSGIVQDLYADFNSIVKKNQVIARLDPTILDTQIEQQKANVARSEADLDRLQVTLTDAEQKLKRAQALSEKNLLPRSELDSAQTNVDSTKAQIKSSQAALVQAKSQLNTAVVNRAHTVITAPIDGIVIQRAVEPGQTVNAGMSAPKLFVIAADLRDMQVNANIDEADVGNMRPGQAVTFRVDAFPTETFTGTVQQVRLQPTTVQNVVTYQTVINVPNQQLKLKPGMTANVNIEISRRQNVLRIPAAATRFRPTTEIFAALKQTPPPDFGRGGLGGRRNAGGGPGGFGGQGGFGGAQSGGVAQPGAGAPAGSAAPGAAANAPSGGAPSQQVNAAQGEGRRQRQQQQQQPGSAAENRGGGDRMPGNAPGAGTPGENRGGFGGGQGQAGSGAEQGGVGRGGVGSGGGRGGFDPNMTPEERRKRMEERMAAMTPEERAAFQERMAARARGGFGGGQGQGGSGVGQPGSGQAQGGGRGGFGSRQGQASGPGQNARPNAGPQPPRTGNQGRVASTPTMNTGGATTIDSLFGPLPTVETRGQAWLFENKQLKSVRLRLGVTDGTYTEVIQSDPEVKDGTEVVTNVIIEQQSTTAGTTNNPLMGPQRARPGGPGGGFGGGGRGGR
jgi:HlyD family secretion protein